MKKGIFSANEILKENNESFYDCFQSGVIIKTMRNWLFYDR